MAKKKQEKLPEYLPSALNTPMLNYRVYYMSQKEKLLTILVSFLAGGGIALIFYGGQFLDVDGYRTQATYICDLILFIIGGAIAVKVLLPLRTRQLQEKRRRVLTSQFRSFLDALAVSLSSGMNMTDSLNSAYADLSGQYPADAYILAEVREMIEGLKNNLSLEDMMNFFADRSEIEDIRSFARVFEISYRAGGNLKEIVRKTNDILSEKIKISEEIETAISSNKTQFSVMLVVPAVIVLMLRLMSSSFARSFATPAGIIANTVALCIFFASYKWGQKIMKVSSTT